MFVIHFGLMITLMAVFPTIEIVPERVTVVEEVRVPTPVSTPADVIIRVPTPVGPPECEDEGDYPFINHPVAKVGDGYDPNWVECIKKPDGCNYCFHPNQGYGNGPAEADKKEV